MPAPKFSDEDLIAAYSETGCNASATARNLNLNIRSFRRRLKSIMERADYADHAPTAARQPPQADPLPPDDIDVREIIAMQRRRFEARLAHAEAKRWREFRIPVSGPYALMFFGDPHIDDNGCNWPLLEEHAALAASTPALYAINIGDTTNNWTGRLAKLWANQDTSAKTARALAKHFLGEMGVPWFLWLHGNHDLWDGPVGAEWFAAIKPHFVHLEQTAMEEWQAKVTLVSPNGFKLRLWAAHNFKGHSMWNPLHGPLRGAQMRDWAHIYAAGHHHDTGLMHFENAERKFYAWLLRCRGYKWLDEYADVHGFPSYKGGASVLAVIDPDAAKVSTVHCFLDPAEGVEFLKWKRGKQQAGRQYD